MDLIKYIGTENGKQGNVKYEEGKEYNFKMNTHSSPVRFEESVEGVVEGYPSGYNFRNFLIMEIEILINTEERLTFKVNSKIPYEIYESHVNLVKTRYKPNVEWESQYDPAGITLFKIYKGDEYKGFEETIKYDKNFNIIRRSNTNGTVEENEYTDNNCTYSKMYNIKYVDVPPIEIYRKFDQKNKIYEKSSTFTHPSIWKFDNNDNIIFKQHSNGDKIEYGYDDMGNRIYAKNISTGSEWSLIIK